MENPEKLSHEGKEQFALALLLLHDFKRQAGSDMLLIQQIASMVSYIGCHKEFNELQRKLPPFDIRPGA